MITTIATWIGYAVIAYVALFFFTYILHITGMLDFMKSIYDCISPSRQRYYKQIEEDAIRYGSKKN